MPMATSSSPTSSSAWRSRTRDEALAARDVSDGFAGLRLTVSRRVVFLRAGAERPRLEDRDEDREEL